MDSVTDKKKDQIKALIEKMKQEGKPIDWATIVLCRSLRVLPNQTELFHTPLMAHIPQKVSSVGEAGLH